MRSHRVTLTLPSDGMERGKKKYGMEVRRRQQEVMRSPTHQAPTQRGSPSCSSGSAPVRHTHSAQLRPQKQVSVSAELIVTKASFVHVHVDAQHDGAQQVAEGGAKD